MDLSKQKRAMTASGVAGMALALAGAAACYLLSLWIGLPLVIAGAVLLLYASACSNVIFRLEFNERLNSGPKGGGPKKR
ncbi:MAG: hypothetical protein LBG62_03635 [Candidatus Methanoplasma sp.]|jgi:hypothetical protein|nr:hypothetical protein [Candidatus Methanoplasma sp.]